MVVRGQDPHPPRDMLALTMPENATITRADGPGDTPPQGGGESGETSSRPDVQPPRRGPEITEIG